MNAVTTPGVNTPFPEILLRPENRSRLLKMIEDVRWEQASALRRERAAHAAQHAEETREKCSTLVGFIREAWPIMEPGVDYVHGWHIDAICEHLEAVTRRQIQHILFNVPPGSMKSLITSVFWPAYEWGPAGLPHFRYLTGSYEQDLALRDNRKMRRLVQSDWFQTLWPLKLTKTGDELFENAVGGNRWARAFDSMTGGRGERVVIDDPHSTKTAESDKLRAKTVRNFREGITDRLNNPARDSIVLMMQRLHHQDVTGVIEDLDIGFERLVIPMEFEPARRLTTSLGWTDPRTEDGELMCPERWPEAVIADLKKAKGSYAWAGQYQQRPSPREGGMFKREWMVGKVLDRAPEFIAEVRHWDLADTELTATDTTGARTAGVRMGLDRLGRFVVTDCIAVGREGVHPLIKATARDDGVHVEVSLPQDPGQAGKVQKRSWPILLAGFKFHVEREQGDKEDRAEPLAVQAEAGNLYIVKGDWNEEYLEEVFSFPGGKRKDIVDASSGAFGRLLRYVDDVTSTGPAGAEVIEPEDDDQPVDTTDAGGAVWG